MNGSAAKRHMHKSQPTETSTSTSITSFTASTSTVVSPMEEKTNEDKQNESCSSSSSTAPSTTTCTSLSPSPSPSPFPSRSISPVACSFCDDLVSPSLSNRGSIWSVFEPHWMPHSTQLSNDVNKRCQQLMVNTTQQLRDNERTYRPLFQRLHSDVRLWSIPVLDAFCYTYLDCRQQHGRAHPKSKLLFQFINAIMACRSVGSGPMLEVISSNEPVMLKIYGAAKQRWLDDEFGRSAPILVDYFANSPQQRSRYTHLWIAMILLALINVWLWWNRQIHIDMPMQSHQSSDDIQHQHQHQHHHIDTETDNGVDFDFDSGT